MKFQFNSFAEFLAMGGHGLFVWLSFTLTFAFIIAMIVYSKAQRNRLYRQITTQQARQTQRHKRTH